MLHDGHPRVSVSRAACAGLLYNPCVQAGKVDPENGCIEAFYGRPGKPPGAGLSNRSIRPFGRSGILEVAIAPLGAAHTYCPDPHSCRYLVAYVNDTVFSCAVGMNTIAFLLSPDFVHKTIRNGGEVVDSIGDD